jgi:hypothetical protein
MLLEHCIGRMDSAQTLVWIVDFQGFSIKDALDPRFSINLVKLLQQHYPERMGCIVCLGAPTAFSGLWNAVKHLMKENTRRKILFVKGGREKIDGLANQLFQAQEAAAWLVDECQKNRDKNRLAATWDLPHSVPPLPVDKQALPGQLSM